MTSVCLHLLFLTERTAPEICGIGDQTLHLARQLRELGHRVTVVASRGSDEPSVRILKDFWRPHNASQLEELIERAQPDRLVLQYTPLMYLAGRRQDRAIVPFWKNCSARWDTTLIVHETYFRAWWHPLSLLSGTLQRRRLMEMVGGSHRIFTASGPLLEEVRDWPAGGAVSFLSLGSNIPLSAVDRAAERRRHGVADNEIVLVLFGGGEGLRRLSGHVEAVDHALSRAGAKASWLLLGGVRPDWFELGLPVRSPGFMLPSDVSGWLQAGDLMLMPHISGVCSKRSALIVALEHGLPVVGTRGPMTESLWNDVSGVALVDLPGRRRFRDAVMRLVGSAELRRRARQANVLHFQQHHAWPVIAQQFIKGVSGIAP